jgi:hypothetical protein
MSNIRINFQRHHKSFYVLTLRRHEKKTWTPTDWKTLTLTKTWTPTNLPKPGGNLKSYGNLEIWTPTGYKRRKGNGRLLLKKLRGRLTHQCNEVITGI